MPLFDASVLSPSRSSSCLIGQVGCTVLWDSKATNAVKADAPISCHQVRDQGAKSAMETKDKYRKWMGISLAVLASLQLYFVRELLAAFALFILVFGLLGAVIAGVYMLQKSWEAGLGFMLASQNRWVLAMRRGISFAEDWARRAIRRTGPELPSNI